jgi:hypothetical protein
MQDTLPVAVSTFRIERIALEDCRVHVHRKYLRVSVPVPLLLRDEDVLGFYTHP